MSISVSLRRAALSVALGGMAAMATAGTLTELAFTSNGGSFINNTIPDFASPLGITANALGAPFLNAADSTVSLGFGTYLAYAFQGFGQHTGSGTISGRRDGVPFSVAASFPADLSVAATFFSFSFGDGETITVSTTGLQADRIRIVADAGGLAPDGVNDGVYRLVYAPIPEAGTLAMMLGGLGVVTALARRRRLS
jgi:hypothetical protein